MCWEPGQVCASVINRALRMGAQALRAGPLPSCHPALRGHLGWVFQMTVKGSALSYPLEKPPAGLNPRRTQMHGY